ncbi:MAG: molecular chaperone HtpG [Angelakisella sp.]
MAVKQFKAESKRLLEMMIHSIYTHREIFLRELISNASDAMDKLYFRSLTDGSVGLSRDDFAIDITVDKAARTLTITDNGVGMTKEELENNLGTIARSGSLDFKKENEQTEDVNIIGQFGVGFYSAFMVAKEVAVTSRAFGSDEAFLWKSSGSEGYTITPAKRDGAGSTIVLHIKDNTEEDSYDEFLESYQLSQLVKRYSDYIRYPIRMEMPHSRKKEDSEEYESYNEVETLNTMIPLWRKGKSEITPEQYNDFYKSKFNDYEDPLTVIHAKTEGSATYDALLYIPARAPYDYYTRDFEKGLQLYSSGVLIMDKCADLLPDYFSFVRGLVDSADLSLNISREMLQHDRQLQIIAKSLEKKIKAELVKLCKNDREKYESFWKNFGRQIKFGLYDGFGSNKDALKELVMFHSSTENKPVTIEEYISRMKEGQTQIYYACGENVSRIEHLPQAELVREKGFELLYLTDDVDEFCLRAMHDYDGKEFKSVSDGDLGLESDEEKESSKKLSDESRPLLDAIKAALGDKVHDVRLSQRLKTHPVCITSEGGLTLEMEKVLSAMPTGNEAPKAQRILELNPSHAIFAKLDSLNKAGSDKLADLAEVLYEQALLIEGMALENPSDYAERVCRLLTE